MLTIAVSVTLQQNRDTVQISGSCVFYGVYFVRHLFKAFD